MSCNIICIFRMNLITYHNYDTLMIIRCNMKRTTKHTGLIIALVHRPNGYQYQIVRKGRLHHN